MIQNNKRQIAAVLLTLLIVASGAAAYTVVFNAGSGTAYESPSGLEVTTGTDHGLSDINPVRDSSTIHISEVFVNSSNDTSITIDGFTGTYTNTSAIDATNGTIQINPDDKSEIYVDGAVTAVDWKNASLDGSNQITYSASGTGTITATGLPASTDFAAATTGGTVLTTGTTDANGNATISVSSATDEYVVLLKPSAPTLSNYDPQDNVDLNDSEVTFSVDLNDADFSGDAGDNVTATLYVDGSETGSDTLTKNGTASATTTIVDGGEHDYYWVAEDNYNQSITSSTRTFNAPSTLKIRQETNPESLVKNSTINITAYYDGKVLRRNTTNGAIDLTGFPTDQPVIVRAQAGNYNSRTAVIESVYEQGNAYLLNESTTSYTVRFDLSDPAGRYPAEDTVLFVDRDIKLNNSTKWRTIAGDNIGIQGVPVELESDERYRIRLKNLETGTSTVLGAYTPVASETVTLSPKSPSIDITDSEKVYDWSLAKNDAGDALVFEYIDSKNNTSNIKLTIHERYNKSNVLVDNESFSSNDLLYQVPMNATQQNTTWMAEVYIDRGDGYMHFREPIGGGVANIIPSNLSTVWTTSVSVFIMLAAAMAFSMLNVGVGAIATSAIGGILWYLGLLAPVATAPSIALAMTVSVLYHYRQGGGF